MHSPYRDAFAARKHGVPLAFSLPANIDTVRGIACLLLVMFHVVGNSPARGLELPGESAWHYATDSFALIRMPVFTILSGILYGCHRADRGNWERFTIKKLRRLAVPLVVLTLLMWSARTAMGEESVSLGFALTHSYEHLWFLQGLIWVFTFVALVDTIYRPPPIVIALLAATTAMLSANIYAGAVFSLEQGLYLLPFFLFGLLLSQLPADTFSPGRGFAALVVALAILAWQQAGLLDLTRDIARDGIPAFICGSAACFALLALSPRIVPLEAIGRYSYSIYLWHIFFLAGSRELLLAAGLRNVPLLFLTCTACGLAGPILLHRVAIRSDWSAVPLLGITRRQQRQPRPA